MRPRQACPGALISTNEDMSTFITALLDGRVVPPAQLGQMMDTVYQPETGFRYGLGLASIDLPCGITGGATAAISRDITA